MEDVIVGLFLAVFSALQLFTIQKILENSNAIARIEEYLRIRNKKFK